MIRRTLLALLLLASLPVFAAEDVKAEAKQFLDLYNSLYLGQTRVDENASWDAITNVTDVNEGRQKVADEAFAVFIGDKTVIETTRRLLPRRGSQARRQLREAHYCQ